MTTRPSAAIAVEIADRELFAALYPEKIRGKIRIRTRKMVELEGQDNVSRSDVDTVLRRDRTDRSCSMPQYNPPKLCAVPGCGRVVAARGWCQTHYKRWRVTGNAGGPIPNRVAENYWSSSEDQLLCEFYASKLPVKDISARLDRTEYAILHRARTLGITGAYQLEPLERFLAKVHKAETGCWEWQGSLKTGNGYGHFLDENGRTGLAHRWAYLHFVGEIPDGYDLDHLCRNRGCVNPEHLEPVPHLVNLHRGEHWAIRINHQQQCKRGHPYATDSYYRDGKRICCRTCERENERRRSEKKQSAATQ